MVVVPPLTYFVESEFVAPARSYAITGVKDTFPLGGITLFNARAGIYCVSWVYR